MDGCRGSAVLGLRKRTDFHDRQLINGSDIISFRVEVGGSSRVMNEHMGQNDYRKYVTKSDPTLSCDRARGKQTPKPFSLRSIKRYASSGNRTRAARVAGEHSTTEPTMLPC